MYYPFVHQAKNCCFLIVVLVFFILSAPAVQAQSDETTAFQSRQDGLACQNKGDYKKALYYYGRAAVLNPGDPATHNDIGLMSEYTGDNETAEDSYLKAIELDSMYLPAYANLGALYKRTGQYVLAVKYLSERIARGQSDDPWTLKAQDDLMEVYTFVPELHQDWIKKESDAYAADLVQSRNKMNKVVARARVLGFEKSYDKGVQALNMGHYDTAIESLTGAVALNPRSGGARNALQRARYEKEKSLLEAQTKLLKEEFRSREVSQVLDIISTP